MKKIIKEITPIKKKVENVPNGTIDEIKIIGGIDGKDN